MMRFCGIHCSALALLGLSLVLCSHSATSQPDLDLDLRHHRLLQRARAAGMATQEWSKRAVEDLLSQLSLPEAEVQVQEDNEVSTVGAGKDDMERSAETNKIPTKERKSCKNFYWKGRTSC
ncbi:somatostatin 1.2 [Engraulis encrasicolus]|uniref:somatostatin 1.2 n=1 Tax=Engraulis encrasicolus TaxID=184585 RepID=UPI002FCE70A1